mgnify:CR=1 FL=1
MEDLNAAKQRTHKLMLTNRRTCTISGVCDVLSFDETKNRLCFTICLAISIKSYTNVITIPIATE